MKKSIGTRRLGGRLPGIPGVPDGGGSTKHTTTTTNGTTNTTAALTRSRPADKCEEARITLQGESRAFTVRLTSFTSPGDTPPTTHTSMTGASRGEGLLTLTNRLKVSDLPLRCSQAVLHQPWQQAVVGSRLHPVTRGMYTPAGTNITRFVFEVFPGGGEGVELAGYTLGCLQG
ncbi:hypothetical protein E2C01_019655 [Portunus trituberculatus]|uniref:Uncharacterized protein n=1 Tax=Portunus trituberculatus TaxID=210409 RepID=A0A5B7DZY5_PORTR|nr:hypothetical protein [Portunus trituberculatus]